MRPPYTDDQWQRIDALGCMVDERLQTLNVGLTMGGEPTFISADDFESAQWRIEALGEDKRRLAGELLKRLETRFAGGGGLLHYGQGKWYPGEVLPRWALGCYWRSDGVPIWRNPIWQADDGKNYGHTLEQAEQFTQAFIQRLAVNPDGILPAYEPGTATLAGFAVPLLPVLRDDQLCWSTCRWTFSDAVDGERLWLIAGESPIGYRLPLEAIAPSDVLADEAIAPLDSIFRTSHPAPLTSPDNSIRVALCVEVRQGTIHVFLPPLSSTGSYVDLIAAIEDTAAATTTPVRIEGYTPPGNMGVVGFQITPDPGVIEVNIHPAESWGELVAIHRVLYEEARQCRLCTEKYGIDGRCFSTGGGAHITIGGKTTAESPVLRRPDLLRSLLTYWQHHPGLSYLFSGQFVGPTSQSPRVDEARHESLYELELAFQALQPGKEVAPPLVDRLLRNLLIDVTGNTHRAEFCIDKLFPVDNLRMQLGLLEFRAISMPPHEHLRSLQLLLIRALVAWFWEYPYSHDLIRWGTTLHDRFLLPHYIAADLQTVVTDLHQAGFPFEFEWFLPFLEFRFPEYGKIIVEIGGGAFLSLELRQAIEIWNVLGEEITRSGTARYVDSSMERIQVTLRGAIGHSPNPHSQLSRYGVMCNHRPVPLHSTGVAGEYVGAVRFRARQLGTLAHPAFEPHAPLVFEIVDQQQNQAIAACTYHVNHPGGAVYESLPATEQAAASRMKERFIPQPPAPLKTPLAPLQICPEYPLTLDLRRN